MKKIYLNKETIKRLAHNEFVAYVSLKTYIDKYIIVPKNQTEIKTYITIDALIYAITNEFSPEYISRRFRENLQNGLDELIANGIINIISCDKKNYFLDVSNLYIDAKGKGDKYFIMTEEEVKKIIFIQTKDKLAFFHYALTIFSTIWTGAKQYGCNTIDDLCSMCGVSKKAGLFYNTLLEENEMIYIRRNKFVNRNEDGTMQHQANTYGRYEHKELIDEASKKHNTRALDKTNAIDSNEKRRIKQIYNSYVNQTYKGSVRMLYDDVLRYNKDYNIVYGEQQLDITIFPSNIEEEDKIVKELGTIKEVELKELETEENEPSFNTQTYSVSKRDIKEETEVDFHLSDYDSNDKLTGEDYVSEIFASMGE